MSSCRSPVRAPDGLAARGNRAVLTCRERNKRSLERARARLDDATWTVTDRQRPWVPGRVVRRWAEAAAEPCDCAPATPGCASKHEHPPSLAG